jgi:hypothetical protein
VNLRWTKSAADILKKVARGFLEQVPSGLNRGFPRSSER